MTVEGSSVSVSCVVRNELNGLRGREEVVHGENYDGSEGPPYMPRMFPIGRWAVTGVFPKKHKYLAPFFIATNARQELPIWDVVESEYDKPSEFTFDDYGYGLHCSSSKTTLGCIRVGVVSELLVLVERIREALDSGEEVVIEVFE